MASVTELLADFIKAPEMYGMRTWLEDDRLKVYVRQRQRLINNQMITTLDIATIDVRPEYQNQGVAKETIEAFHAMNPWDATYVENVLIDFLAIHLEKESWIRDPAMLYDVSFYKPTTP